MKDGYGIGKIAWSGKSSEGIGYAKEGWDLKLIPTEPNKLSDYLKGISL